MSGGVLLRLRKVDAELQSSTDTHQAVIDLQPGEQIMHVEGGLVAGFASFVLVTATELADAES